VAGQTVVVHWHKHDRYGRLLGTLTLDGRDLNLAQVRAGLAWHYKRYQNDQPPADRTSYAAAETEARTARLGLWREPNPLPPWEYRKTKKTATRQASR
jgi:endonuclease YncB( thermonuclease family)